MKIIHTADWHIGKRLYNTELKEDFDRFIEWLFDFIVAEKVNYLLVSGDVFDLANPSSEARAQYYNTLVKLGKTGVKMILTGGNHDSPSHLNAPKELLRALGIVVIGGMTEEISEMIIPLHEDGEIKAVVAAIPYLRDVDIRKAVIGESYSDRKAAIREGIDRTFKSASEYIHENHPDVPLIAMGHLYTSNASTSDSERDIQIGNLASYDGENFKSLFDYVALGHIHRPQMINEVTYYSGSPIALSFSEISDRKRIMLLQVEEGIITPTSIDVPSFRKLLRLKGALPHIQEKLRELPKHEGLNTLIEVYMEEAITSSENRIALEQDISDFNREGYEIVKHFIRFLDASEPGALTKESQSYLEDLRPLDVFEAFLGGRNESEETKEKLKEAFISILEEVTDEDS